MTYSRPWMFLGLSFMATGAILLCQQGCQPAPPDQSNVAPASAPPCCAKKAPAESTEKPAHNSPLPQAGEGQGVRAADPTQWKDLFDGKTLAGWKTPEFGGEGKVSVKDGAIVMEMGAAMTGVTYTGEVIRNNYELTLEGMRLEGSDFFCTTTFPVGDDPCTLVVGGWGGMVVGLSNVDFYDASENPTTKTVTFKEKQWYRVRIRVSDAAIEAWIDDQQLVNQARKGHKFSIRLECDLCKPLGISTWCTAGAVRNIRVRKLKPEEVRAIADKQEKAAD
jgi:hypothetical protein